MTEKEKALKGYLFKQGDPDLALERQRAKDLCFELNLIAPSKIKERNEILKQLIPDHQESFTITSPFYCDYGTHIHLGNRFFSNYDCKIIDGGEIIFGDDVRIGPNCSFLTVNHALDPIQRKEGYEIFQSIHIGDNVWFGSNVVVNPGISIGSNSIIGSGSIVTKDIPSNVLAVGNPCKVIRQLTKDDQYKYPTLDNEIVL